MTLSSSRQAKPFLKWAGGKSQLLAQLRPKYPKELKPGLLKNYYEPFLGGGAIFFDWVQNYPLDNFYLSDINEELILVYQVVQTQVNTLIDFLQQYQQQYLRLAEPQRVEYFYEVRTAYNQNRFHINYQNLSEAWIPRAAQMIFLNKTAYNGLFRVNRSGAFNVPFGQYKRPHILDADNLRKVSQLLQLAEIRVADFGALEQRVTADSFVYFDPPYRPLSQTASFTHYDKTGFTDSEQIRLAKTFRVLHERGAKLMLCNSDPQNVSADENSEDFFEKYYAGFQMDRVFARRMINSVAQNRGRLTELVITNYDHIY